MATTTDENQQIPCSGAQSSGLARRIAPDLAWLQ